ncbi:MAG TPA: geranylgeranylglycerol-phosphate geranylgeranyltransferase [Flavipsychrobacter sp.]|nr:geranylgeranylglycerol-phosphate geranylgeranyltransferase [Flavipsychrobacter sp.]
MIAWLKLIRWNNLLIVFLTQLLAWCCVLLPMWHYTESPMFLNWQNFLLISLSTILIAAAGYIINDYFDIKIDIINKPDKVILEKRIPRRMAIIVHSTLNAIAIFLAAIVARRAGHYEWLLLQIVCTVLLWFYSTHFKRQFIIGNVVVALLTSFTIIALMLYEPAIHYYFFKSYFINTSIGNAPNPVWVLGIYAYFAFVLTWIREIVKDMEDYKGDAQEGCITMPIKWGLKRSVQFIQALGLLVIIPLIIAGIKLCINRWWPLGIYSIAALVLPMAIWSYFLQRKNTTQHYHIASRWLKIIMVLGIGSLIIYYFQAHA